MPRLKLDPLTELVRRFAWMSETSDANGWVAARASSGPEVRAFFSTHAPTRLKELDALLGRPIPPAFPTVPPPADSNLQKHLGLHRLNRDAAAREVMAGILALLKDIQQAQAAQAAKPTKSAKTAKKK